MPKPCPAESASPRKKKFATAFKKIDTSVWSKPETRQQGVLHAQRTLTMQRQILPVIQMKKIHQLQLPQRNLSPLNQPRNRKKNLSHQNRPQPSLRVKAYCLCLLTYVGSRYNPVELDVSEVTVKSKGKNSLTPPDAEEEELDPLPGSIIVELTIKECEKLRRASEQFPIDPRQSFSEFQVQVFNNVEDIIGITNSELIKLYWKWEKRILAQSTSKKTVTESSRLARDHHWTAIQQVIRESASKKNGCNNMLLKIRADVATEAQLTTGEVADESTGPSGIVLSFISSSNCYRPVKLGASLIYYLECRLQTTPNIFKSYRIVTDASNATLRGEHGVGYQHGKGFRNLITQN